MADKKDYYEVLDTQKGASEDEIKKAYRNLAKKYHPDANPGDKNAEKRFKEINEAYMVLSDAEKRAAYDQFGHAGVDQSGMGGFDPSAMDFDIGDIFGSFFGGGFGSRGERSSVRHGENIGIEIGITFEEAAFGVRREVTYNRIEKCGVCGGSGAAPGTSPETCKTCHGTGTVRSTQRTMLGMMQTTRSCPDCRGTGKHIKDLCHECRGEGRVKRKKTLEFNIPGGINDGERISLRNQGNAGAGGGQDGDLIIIVRVKPHHFFERKGYDLFCELPVTFPEAALGAKVTVPTLEGKSEFTIPEGTQSGSVFSLRGKGVKYINSERKGDLYVTVTVETPKNLNAKQKEALRKFDSVSSAKIYEKKQRFLDKLKK